MATALIAAMILDAIFGEPRLLWDRVPHPAVLMGRPISWADKTFNTGQTRRMKGTFTLILLLASAYFIGRLITAVPGQILDVLIAAMLLAQRSLVDHVRAVTNGLGLSLGEGRRAVGNIVSRDTSSMTASDVSRSAIESAAENLSDGVVAPAFWFLIGGLPGLLIYKVTNTADSMIGYLTPRYAEFGWAAARFDDLLNWLPARITAAILWLLTPNRAPWAEVTADARLHKSPNAGWPEAAMSRALGIALAGPRSYDGRLQNFPFVNPQGRKALTASDIERATGWLWRVWAVILICLLPLSLF